MITEIKEVHPIKKNEGKIEIYFLIYSNSLGNANQNCIEISSQSSKNGNDQEHK